MSGKVDTSLPGVEYNEEYEEVEIEHEMFSDESDVIVSQETREVEIFRRDSIIVAVERSGESIDYVSTYDSDRVSIEAVARYFSQYDDWEVVFAKDCVNLGVTGDSDG